MCRCRPFSSRCRLHRRRLSASAAPADQLGRPAPPHSRCTPPPLAASPSLLRQDSGPRLIGVPVSTRHTISVKSSNSSHFTSPPVPPPARPRCGRSRGAAAGMASRRCGAERGAAARWRRDLGSIGRLGRNWGRVRGCWLSCSARAPDVRLARACRKEFR
jgi:hypothetical protein